MDGYLGKHTADRSHAAVGGDAAAAAAGEREVARGSAAGACGGSSGLDWHRSYHEGVGCTAVEIECIAVGGFDCIGRCCSCDSHRRPECFGHARLCKFLGA